MMRTIKYNIKRWKIAALAMMLPLVFFFVACQDQVGDDVMEIAKNSSHALVVPAQIQSRYDELKKENPEKNFSLLELNESASEKLANLEKTYGLPKSIEVFKVVDGNVVDQARGEAEHIVVENGTKKSSKNGEQTFAILEFNDQTSKLADEASGEDKIYTVVEEQPEFPGGYPAMMEFIRSNMRYPLEARQQGIEGTVYVSFIVGSDGTVSDVKTVRGIGASADDEAKRVVESFPNWIPEE